MQVKICGIKNIEAAEASIENGANYLGFNFIKSSKRLISAEDSLLIVNKLRKSFPNIFIQVGGGIRTKDTIEKYLSHGVDRIILGTKVLKNNFIFSRFI